MDSENLKSWIRNSGRTQIKGSQLQTGTDSQSAFHSSYGKTGTGQTRDDIGGQYSLLS